MAEKLSMRGPVRTGYTVMSSTRRTLGVGRLLNYGTGLPRNVQPQVRLKWSEDEGGKVEHC
jgi:hypothetical protein